MPTTGLIQMSMAEYKEKRSPYYKLRLPCSVANIAEKGTDISAGFPDSSREITFTFLNFLET